MHKQPFILISLFVLNTFYSIGQTLTDSIKFNYTMLPLTISTPIVVTSNSQKQKDITLENRILTTVNFQSGKCQIVIDSTEYNINPELYNITISLIKDKQGHIIGMTKKYRNHHLIQFGEKTYKTEYLSSGQLKVVEMKNTAFDQEPTVKRMTIEGYGKTMEIFHNLNEIPIVMIPTILNTRILKKKQAGITLWGLFGIGATAAFRELINKGLSQ